MSLLFECGTFTFPNTTAQQTITLNNGSLTPKAIIMWTTGPGTTSDAFSAGAIFSMGFGTRRGGSTQSGCIGIINIDNVGTSDSARVRNTTLLHVLSSTSATDYTITLDSFGAGSVTITASSGTNANGDRLHYMVWGGTDLTDAIVINHIMDSVGATEAITGTGFQPDALFALDAAVQNANTITAGLIAALGFASSSTLFASMNVNADDADTMTSGMAWQTRHGANACLLRPSAAGGGDAHWDLDSFDSDGATLGVVDAPAATNQVATFLFLKGGQWEAGVTTKDTDTGTDDTTLANSGLTPKGLFTFNIRSTSADGLGVSASTDFAVGATDGTREIAAGITGTEAINTATDRFWSNTKAMVELTGNTPTLTSAADFSAFSAGAFQLNWSSNGGAANRFGYMVWGDNASNEEQGAGSSDGVATVTGVGHAITKGAGSSTAAATVTGVGRMQAKAAGSSAGVATVEAHGAVALMGAGSSTGQATVTAVGRMFARASGSSAGVSTVVATGQAIAQALGSSAGLATVAAIGRALTQGVGLSEGVATVVGIIEDGNTGGTEEQGAGLSQGVATVLGVGQALTRGSGLSQGVATVQAFANAIAKAAGTSAGIATVAGVLTNGAVVVTVRLGTGIPNVQANDTGRLWVTETITGIAVPCGIPGVLADSATGALLVTFSPVAPLHPCGIPNVLRDSNGAICVTTSPTGDLRPTGIPGVFADSTGAIYIEGVSSTPDVGTGIPNVFATATGRLRVQQ